MQNRVLIVASFAESLLNFRGSLIQDLVSAGCDVCAIAPDIDSEVAAGLKALGATCDSFPLDRTGTGILSEIRTIYWIRRHLQRQSPDVVLAYTAKPVIYSGLALLADKKTRFCPLITGLGSAFSVGASSMRVRRRIVSALYRLSIRRADRVVFQNPDDEAEFRRLRILRRNQATFVVDGSGVDLDHYCVRPVPRRISFLMICRLVRSKGVREYLEAAALVKKRHPEVRFSLIGWQVDSPEAVSECEVKELASRSSVEYSGYVRDVRQALESTCVFVHPSYYREGIPRTVLEAMAMGRAVVTCDTPGCRETVSAGENGILVPPQSAEALTAAMLSLIERPDLVLSMGEASRRIAERRFDVRIVNNEMLRIMLSD